MDVFFFFLKLVFSKWMHAGGCEGSVTLAINQEPLLWGLSLLDGHEGKSDPVSRGRESPSFLPSKCGSDWTRLLTFFFAPASLNKNTFLAWLSADFVCLIDQLFFVVLVLSGGWDNSVILR